ncbi:MAG: hypothetical protein QOH04_226 [Sphingomonadales bacterium]|jgi:hypothetical protein|nr:hypothetical protein [Sphingomonadales bacterium]
MIPRAGQQTRHALAGALNLALLFLPVAPALAAPAQSTHVPLGSRLPVPDWDQPETADQAKAHEVLRIFADCIVKTKPAQAQALLMTPPNSPQQTRAVSAIVGQYSSCLKYSGEMQLSPTLFRGAIAESLWRGTAAGRTLEQAEASPPDFERFVAALNASSPNAARYSDWPALVLGRWMAFCAAGANPAGVDRLLWTGLGTAEELTALNALRPTLAACLTQNQTVETNRITTRALLAEALYRRQPAPAPAPKARASR